MTLYDNENIESIEEIGLRESEHLSRKIKHGIKWQFITNLLGQAVYFGNGIILARILSPKDFGIYGMSLVLSDFVFMFWNLGLNAAIIQRKEISKKHLDTAFTLYIIMGVACFLITWIFAPLLAVFFKEPIVCSISRIIALTFLIYALDRIPTALLTRGFNFKVITLTGLANPVIYGLVSITLAILGFGPVSFAWGVVLGTLGVSIGKIIIGLRLYSWRPTIIVDKKCAKHLLGFGVFIMLADIANYFFGNLQKIITGKFFGAVELGYFTRSYNLSLMPLQKVQANVSNVLLPAFSGIQDNKEKIRNWFRKFNFFTFSIISPPMIFFIFFPNDIIVGLFGSKWSASSPLLVWLSVSVMLGSSGLYCQNILRAIGKPHLPLIISVIVFVPFVLLLLIGSTWGILGIAISLAISSFIGFVSYILVMRINKILTVKDILISSVEPILVSISASGPVFLIKPFIYKKDFIPEISLVFMVCIFVTFLLPYYLIRYFKKNFISYLNFNIKEVLKL